MTPLTKPSPSDAIAGHDGTFSLNAAAGTYTVDPAEKQGFNMLSVGHLDTVIVSELYVNNDPTNVADKYILNPASTLQKFDLIIAKENEQFTEIVWSGGAITMIR